MKPILPEVHAPLTNRCIIACGSKKLEGRHTAKTLYVGNLFKACLRDAQRHYADWLIFILSAKHGLIRCTDIIDSYNQRLPTQADQRRQLAERVRIDGMNNGCLGAPEILFLGARPYYAILRAAFQMPSREPSFTAPLLDLEIGQCLHVLKQRSQTAVALPLQGETYAAGTDRS